MKYKVLVWKPLDLPDADTSRAAVTLEPITTKMTRDLNELSLDGWRLVELFQEPSVDHLIVVLKRENFLQRIWSNIEHLEYYIVNWDNDETFEKYAEDQRKDGWKLHGFYKLNKPWRWVSLMKRRVGKPFDPEENMNSMYYMYGMR